MEQESTKTYHLRELSSFGVPGSVGGIAYDGQYLWLVAYQILAHGDKSVTLIKYDLQTRCAISSFEYEKEESWPSGLAWSGEHLWLNYANSMIVKVIDPETGEVQRQHQVSVGTWQAGRGLSYYDGHIFVNGNNGVIEKLTVEDGRPVALIENPLGRDGGNRGIAANSEGIWLANSNQESLAIIDTSGQIVAYAKLGELGKNAWSPGQLHLTFVNENIFLTRKNRVHILAIDQNAVVDDSKDEPPATELETIYDLTEVYSFDPVPLVPSRRLIKGFHFDGRLFWLAMYGSGEGTSKFVALIHYDPENNTILKLFEFELGSSVPAGLAVSNDHVWVNYIDSNDTILRIDLIDPITGMRYKQFGTNYLVKDIAYNSGYVYYHYHYGFIEKVDASNGGLLATYKNPFNIDVGQHAGIAVRDDEIWLSNLHQNKLSILDIAGKPKGVADLSVLGPAVYSSHLSAAGDLIALMYNGKIHIMEIKEL